MEILVVSDFSPHVTACEAEPARSTVYCGALGHRAVHGRNQDSLMLALQRLACGIPVAAVDNPHFEDLISAGEVGAAKPDSGRAITGALRANRQICRRTAERFTWEITAADILRRNWLLNPEPQRVPEVA